MFWKESKEESQILDCSSFTDGTFYRPFTETDSTRFIQIEGNSHKEFHNNRQKWIFSDIEWNNDCECELTINELNYDNFPAKVGDKLRIKVTRIDGNIIYYMATNSKGKIKRGRLKKTHP